MSTKVGTHYSNFAGGRATATSAPSNPQEGQSYIDNLTGTHYIYAGGQWWGVAQTTTTSTSTTTTSTSTTTTSTSTSSTTSTSSSTSTSTTTTV